MALCGGETLRGRIYVVSAKKLFSPFLSLNVEEGSNPLSFFSVSRRRNQDGHPKRDRDHFLLFWWRKSRNGEAHQRHHEALSVSSLPFAIFFMDLKHLKLLYIYYAICAQIISILVLLSLIYHSVGILRRNATLFFVCFFGSALCCFQLLSPMIFTLILQYYKATYERVTPAP